MRDSIIVHAVDPKTGKTRMLERVDSVNPIADEPWNLGIDDLVRMSGKTRRWIFAHAGEMGWVKRITRKTLRGDAALLRKWIASRR
jgi:hypothetical protein